MSRPPQIFGYSGPDYESGQPTAYALLEYALGLASPAGRLRLCYVPTAVGDAQRHIDHYTSVFMIRPEIDFSVLTLFPQPSFGDVRGHLLAQDVVFVEGGSVVNLMAVWRAHGLPEILRECWESGVVLTGGSAGSLCWHQGGLTDSFSDNLDPFTDGIGLLPYSNGVHDDMSDQPRRETYRQMVADGTFGAGYASDDGVGLHYVGTELVAAISIRDGKKAWHVAPDGSGGATVTAIEPRRISPSPSGRCSVDVHDVR
jgi:peptidase E